MHTRLHTNTHYSNHLFLLLHTQDMAPVLTWLSHLPSVRWLSPRMHTRLHNLKAAAAVQSGGEESSGQSAMFPFWQVRCLV